MLTRLRHHTATLFTTALAAISALPVRVGGEQARTRSGRYGQNIKTGLTPVEAGQHFRHDTGMMNQVDVRRGGHMADLGPGQAGAGRGKDDVVAVAVAAEKKAAT